MGDLVIGFMSLLVSSVTLIAGLTGSSVTSVARGAPDRAHAGTPTATMSPGAAVDPSSPSTGTTSTKGANDVAKGKPARTELETTAKAHNWNTGDWLTLIGMESGGRSTATNPSSGAFGIGQFLGATKAAYAKYGATSTDPVKQIKAMARYIADRYGTPTAALAHEHAYGWY